MSRRGRLGALLVLVLALVAGCTPPGAAGPAPSAPAVLADERVADLVEQVPHRTVKNLPVARLADGLTPPTNRWYSGLVFGEKPMPVFPLPLSFGLTAEGFSFGLPKVGVTERTIAGGFAPDVAVGLGAASWTVAGSDASVVVLDGVGKDGERLGRATIAQGSPFVSWVAERAVKATIPAGFEAAGEGLFSATLAGTRYALLARDATVDGTSVDVGSGGSLVFWPVPVGHGVEELAEAASHVVTGSRLAYQVGESTVTTELTYLADGATAIARMPHQLTGADGAEPSTAPGCDLGSYPSIYGTMTLCAGSTLTWTTPRHAATATLNLSGLGDDQRRRLGDQLAADAASLPDFPADTYFGGKALQRTAMLLMVADQLGAAEQARTLAQTLDAQLSRWFDPRGCDERQATCFVYDPDAKGMVGLTPSFGSDEFNDHHFHYGYFLYAAAVMAEHDPSVVDRYAPVLDLLAADLASSGSPAFPDRRTFDAYASHSWASGTSPFADGNNQESVSEAVNAWAGLALWARATGDEALEGEADWMLSLEADSSRRYWTNPDLSQFDGYGAGIVSLNWGGKRDFATWFSDAPAAKLAILLLPMSPSSGYLAGDPASIRAEVAAATGGRFAQKFGDYVLMYSALAGSQDRAAALAAVDSLPDGVLDDGLSRTYLLAWLLAPPA